MVDKVYGHTVTEEEMKHREERDAKIRAAREALKKQNLGNIYCGDSYLTEDNYYGERPLTGAVKIC